MLMEAATTWANHGVPAAAMAVMALACAAGLRWLAAYFRDQVLTLQGQLSAKDAEMSREVTRLNDLRVSEQRASADQVAALTRETLASQAELGSAVRQMNKSLPSKPSVPPT